MWVGDRFELTHRLHLSDAILALRTLDKSANVDTLEGQAVLAIYVERNFGIDGVDTPKTLTTLGAEIDDDFFYVYQEWVTALPKSMPSFYSTVLEDILADTHSWIHYETPDTQQTLELSKNP